MAKHKTQILFSGRYENSLNKVINFKTFFTCSIASYLDPSTTHDMERDEVSSNSMRIKIIGLTRKHFVFPSKFEMSRVLQGSTDLDINASISCQHINISVNLCISVFIS